MNTHSLPLSEERILFKLQQNQICTDCGVPEGPSPLFRRDQTGQYSYVGERFMGLMCPPPLWKVFLGWMPPDENWSNKSVQSWYLSLEVAFFKFLSRTQLSIKKIKCWKQFSSPPLRRAMAPHYALLPTRICQCRYVTLHTSSSICLFVDRKLWTKLLLKSLK